MTGSIANLNAVFDKMAATNQGYSQDSSPTTGRWSYIDRAVLAAIVITYALAKALAAIIPGRAQDCSSGCLGGAKLAGYPVDISGTAYTGNAADLLRAAGFTILRWTGMDSWRPGDFIVTPGHHIVYCRDWTRWWSAEANEKGTATGGAPGNQNGVETRYRAPYDITFGGTRTAYVCRPPAEAQTLTATTGQLLVVDGVFGAKTVAALQRVVGVKDDGVYGPQTKRALQAWLGVAVDGIVGPKTVRALQAKVGASVDGDWGPKTTRALQAWLNAHAGTAL